MRGKEVSRLMSEPQLTHGQPFIEGEARPVIIETIRLKTFQGLAR